MRCLLLLLICSVAYGQPRDLQLFLLIGQSNMAGRGKIEASDREPIPRGLLLNKELGWGPAGGPMHFDQTEIAGGGIPRTFARALGDAQPSAYICLNPS